MFDNGFYNQPLTTQLQLIAGSLCYREHTLKYLEDQSINNAERIDTLIEIIYLKELRQQLIRNDSQPSHSIPNAVATS